MFKPKHLSPLALCTIEIFTASVLAAPRYRWFVNGSTALAGISWAVCGYVLPAHSGLGCVAAAMLVGINAVIQAHGGNGQRGAFIGTRDVEDGHLRLHHHTPAGITHDFINTTALTHDWHNVTVQDHPLNLIVRRLPDGRIHARTQGFKAMGCPDGQCAPQEKSLTRRTLDKRAIIYEVEDIDFSWTEPDGYGTKTQTGVEAAASGAAGYVVDQPRGETGFCSRAISGGGLTANVGFNFYGDGYATQFPPPCS